MLDALAHDEGSLGSTARPGQRPEMGLFILSETEHPADRFEDRPGRAGAALFDAGVVVGTYAGQRSELLAP